MGKRGPAGKPTNLRLLHGDAPSRINTAEPKPGELEVVAPDWLGEEAREVWAGLAPDLEAKRVLTVWDAEAFGAWCDAVVRRRTAVAALAVEGEVTAQPVFNKNGEQTGVRHAKNPWLFVLNEADAQLQRYAARFGLTPSDRAGLTVGEPVSAPGADLLTG